TAHPSAGGRRARRRPSPRCRNRRSSSCARGPTAWPDARRGRGSPSARRRDLDARVARLRLFGPLRPWIKFTSISRILTTKILFDETFLTLEGPISLLVWSHGCVWEYGCPWLLHPSTNLQGANHPAVRAKEYTWIFSSIKHVTCSRSTECPCSRPRSRRRQAKRRRPPRPSAAEPSS